MKKLVLLFFVFHFSFLVFHLSEAQILRVPAEYPTIQSAVDAAGYGDTVLVDTGTYLENIMIQGNNKTITLASMFLLSDSTNDINNTIIDASQPQNPNYGMGIFIKNQDSTLDTRIIGFTIINGTGYYKTFGGGINAIRATPTIEYNHIRDCSITGIQPMGGGIRIGNTGGDTTRICHINNNVIEYCSITPNTVGGGAGIALNSVSAVLENNEITHNTIIGDSLAICWGGGIYWEVGDTSFHYPTLVIRNNLVAYNQVLAGAVDGGGMDISGDFGSHPVLNIEGNMISHNLLSSDIFFTGTNYGGGGGIFLLSPAEGSVVSGNEINDNMVQGPITPWGGGIFIAQRFTDSLVSQPVIEKNFITGNTAGVGGAIYCTLPVRIVNNFISGNVADSLAGAISLNEPVSPDFVTEIINNTIISNTVTGAGGEIGSLYLYGFFSALLMNNIFYENQAETTDEIKIKFATVEMHNCDVNTEEVDGPWTGDGNFYEPPDFKDDNLHIYIESPCFDAGLESVQFAGTWHYCPDTDIDNDERPYPDPLCPLPEIGADEYASNCVGITEEVQSLKFKVESYPNPTNGIVNLQFTIYNLQRMSLEIFDIHGREIVTVFDQQLSAGEQLVQYDASWLPAGVYFYQLTVDSRQLAVGKLVKY